MFCMQSTKVLISATRLPRAVALVFEELRATIISALRVLARSCKQTNIFSGSDSTSTLGELTGEGELSLVPLAGNGDRDRSIL